MTTRRDFLKTGGAAVAAGVVFCNCGLLHSAQAQQPRPLSHRTESCRRATARFRVFRPSETL